MTVPTSPQLRVVVAAGGTAGHLAPALVVADSLRTAGHDVSFIASSGRRDAELIGARGYESQLIAIDGLPRKLGVGQARSIWRAVTAVFTCARMLRGHRPDVVLAGGGFVSAPVAVAARLLRIPAVATEADAHLGLANRIAGRCARRLCTAYPLPQLRMRQEVVGRPVDPAFFDAHGVGARSAARERWSIPADARVVAVVGGSGGATKLNDAAHAAWGADADPRVEEAPLWILHVSGRRDHASVLARGIASERYQLIEYCYDMPGLFAAADVVVTRPGGSVFELAAVGRASVLVPSPNVTADHQTLNARWFVERGGGVLVEDAGLDGEHLRGIVRDLLAPAGDARREELEHGMHALARPGAADRIATIVAECGAAHVRMHGQVERPVVEQPLPLAGRRLHMLGISGAGVSALAQLARAWGATVDGCDKSESEYGRLVAASGVPVLHGHDPAHVSAGMELIVSSAIPQDHPELREAKRLDCRVVLRGAFLGELTQLRDTVVVAGAHGKSTTTGMLAHAGTLAGLDPAVALGATLPSLREADGSGGNVRLGDGPFIVEGDESDRTLLRLAARVAVVTNIERDHHHTFASDADVEELFAQWVRSLGSESILVAGPGAALDRLVVHAPGRVVRYGEIEAEIAEIAQRLAVPGRHNALNALAAVAVLQEYGIERAAAVEHVASFPGVGRRFELVGGSDAAGVTVIDDYAHHPTEVEAAIQAARERADQRGGRVLVAFQPHLYSRTQALWERFAAALAGADRAWVLPIYGAREEPMEGVDERLIADELVRLDPNVYAGRGIVDPATGDVATIVDEAMDRDILMTMGAGSVTQLAPRLHAALLERAPMQRIDEPDWLEHDVALHKFTTIGTGGTARHFAKVATEPELQAALTWARARDLPHAVIGLGSNSLISDDGFDGLAIRLVDQLARIEIDHDGARVVLGGGASLGAAVRLCRDAGLSGFEFACAIPGTAGGATKMNAGAYGSEMRDVLTRVRVVTADGVSDVDPASLNMRYRGSDIDARTVVAQVELALTRDEPEAIKSRVQQLQAKRSDAQPRAARSFGSVFQNPTNVPAGAASAARKDDGTPLGAGALIELAGLKGHRIGGACISPKHGNFIENDEGASTADIVALIRLARTTVAERFGVELATEVHVLGRDGYRSLFDQHAGASA